MPFKVTRPFVNFEEKFAPAFNTIKNYPTLSPTSSGSSK